MKYIYLGAVPPPFGGVTIKNKLLFEKLSGYIEIEQANFNKPSKNKIMRLISLFLLLFSNKHNLIIGISKNSLKILTLLLFFINKKLMNRSIVIVMGGTFSQIVADDKIMQKRVKEYKHIYVETAAMKRVFNSVGIDNVTVFPNCRERPNREIQSMKITPTLKCLFFSLISQDKGIDNILDASAILEQKDIDYSIDFYGHIDQAIEKSFQQSIALNKKLNYCGVFKSSDKDEVYEKLNSYDILLFPTKWKNEGVPGVLVESKIASLPAIVSNVNYNSEIIEDGKTGIVLSENTPNDLANAIEQLYLNRDKLSEMRHNAKSSSEEYLIENYIKDIVNKLLSK